MGRPACLGALAGCISRRFHAAWSCTNSTREVKDKEMDHERWPNIEFGLVAEKEPSRSPTCVLVVGLAVLAVCATCAALLAFHASQP